MIFDRPTKAFFAYERAMMRPASWPPTKHDVPTLWERAKAMFASVVKAAGSARQLAQRYRFTRSARAEIVNRLKPVEKIVRILLMIEAATFLLMTPEGARMRREAKLAAPPASPAPPARPHSTRIVMPGWHTIAALHPRIDPRVVEREAREHEQAQREALERAMNEVTVIADLPGKGAHDALDPATWRCCFPVIRWKQAEPAAPQKPQTSRLLCAVLDDDSNFPITHEMVPRLQSREAEPVDGHPGAIAVARRIEALARVLADPRAAIRQVARRLAAIPPDMIRTPDMSEVKTRRWHHGKPESWNAANLCEPAINALTTAARHVAMPPPEPG